MIGRIPDCSETYDAKYFKGIDGLYLHHLDQRVTKGCQKAVDAAVEFMCTTTRGLGHNRHRAKLSRLLKHVELRDSQSEKIVDTVLQRFENGDIDEQFIEQLRFSLWLSRDRTIEFGARMLGSEKEYIVRYAKKLLNLGGAK